MSAASWHLISRKYYSASFGLPGNSGLVLLSLPGNRTCLTEINTRAAPARKFPSPARQRMFFFSAKLRTVCAHLFSCLSISTYVPHWTLCSSSTGTLWNINKTYGMFLGYKPGAWPPRNGEKGKPKRAHFTEAPAPEIMV